jgi:hypothetical protein
MTTSQIKSFLHSRTYDIRISGNGRWIDQKCALDSVCFVADCILEYIQSGGKQPFKSVEIWHSPYAEKNVQHIFGKPDPNRRTAIDEYNKFYRQPMKMLAAAGVLSEKGKNPIFFTVEYLEILEHIALREKNSFEFLCLYIEKTLKDSGLWYSFEAFFELQNKEAYDELKQKFVDFCIKYTKMDKKLEPSRIFIKVLNHLACDLHKKGTVSGRLSSNMITYDKIAYNKTNWRDDLAGKDKNIARGDFSPMPQNDGLFQYRVTKAKKYMRIFNEKYNNSRSEVINAFAREGRANTIHHIFPQNQFKEIADYLENLIAITAGQHQQQAHPDGNTQLVDKDFQYLCLISKTGNIQRNLTGNLGESMFYKFEDFMYVLNIGLNTEYFSKLHNCDFSSVLAAIDKYF